MFSTLSDLWTKYKPAIVEFFEKLFTDPKKLFIDTIKPLLSSAFSSIFENLGWVAIGLGITTLIVKMLATLNPWVKIATLLFAGIASVFDWEGIKDKFSASELGKSISKKFNTIVAGISSIFNWENIKAWLSKSLPSWTPDWVKNKLAAGPTASEPSTTTANPEVTVPVTVPDTSGSTTSSDTSGSTTTPEAEGDSWWDKLSTKIDELKDEFKKNTTATRELKGNLQ